MLPETAQILDEVSQLDGMEGFFLVGGTALALHASHRLSEDLDFATTDSVLNAKAVASILAQLGKTHVLQDATSIGDIQAALNEGLDLATVQQNWLVDKVRLTFFVLGDNAAERSEIGQSAMQPYGRTRVLGMDGLFLTKCLALCDRIKSRDIFDLHWMVTEGGRNVAEIFETIQGMRPHITYEQVRYRLLDWPIPKTDEGFVSLVNHGKLVPEEISIEDIREALRELVNTLEVRLAQSSKAKI